MHNSIFTQKLLSEEYKLFVLLHNNIDYSDFYFDEHTDTFVSKFIGKDNLADDLTNKFRKFKPNYATHLSLYKSCQNLQSMKIDSNATVTGDQLNKFIDTIAVYMNELNLKL